MANVTVKIPRATYLAAKAAAKKRGCFIGKLIADAVTLYNSYQEGKTSTITVGPPKEQVPA